MVRWTVVACPDGATCVCILHAWPLVSPLARIVHSNPPARPLRPTGQPTTTTLSSWDDVWCVNTGCSSSTEQRVAKRRCRPPSPTWDCPTPSQCPCWDESVSIVPRARVASTQTAVCWRYGAGVTRGPLHIALLKGVPSNLRWCAFGQGSRDTSGGARVTLDLAGVQMFSLFPGQVIGALGTNSTGLTFSPSVIYQVGAPRVPLQTTRSVIFVLS